MQRLKKQIASNVYFNHNERYRYLTPVSGIEQSPLYCTVDLSSGTPP